jgi:hypothetical protein
LQMNLVDLENGSIDSWLQTKRRWKIERRT